MKYVKDLITPKEMRHFISLFSAHRAKAFESGKTFENITNASGTAVARQEAMATAEYAVVTLAAVGLAGLLITILRSEAVRNMLMDIILKSLSSFSPL